MITLLVSSFAISLIFLLLLLVNEIRNQKSQSRQGFYFSSHPSPGRRSSWDVKVARAYKRSAPKQTRNASPSNPFSWRGPGAGWRGKASRLGAVTGATRQQLFALTGDWAVSDRLVQQVMQRNPGQSEQWAYEKAIYDLERDRL